MESSENPIFAAMYGRRSIRDYQDRPVEREKIVQLLKAAMAAPSACNIQPWEFIVVTEPETVGAIKASIRQWGGWNAPVILAVCSYTAYIPWQGDPGTIDCAAAIENLLLAAYALGLGTVCVGGFDPDAVRRILDIPESVHPVCLVYLGYPAEQPEPRTQYLEEAVYWEKYDPARPHPPRPGNILV